MSEKTNNHDGKMKRELGKALEYALAKPSEVKSEVLTLQKHYTHQYAGSKSDVDIKNALAKKLVSKYSYYAGLLGSASALAKEVFIFSSLKFSLEVIADESLLLKKLQINMVRAVAAVFGYADEIKEVDNVDATLDMLDKLFHQKKGRGKMKQATAFAKGIRNTLKGASVWGVRSVCKRFNLTVSAKGVEKAVSVAVDTTVGFTVYKVLTWLRGNKARKYYDSLYEAEIQCNK